MEIRPDHASVAVRCSTVVLAGVPLLADPAGAIVHEPSATLIVADLHLEKGSAFAERGTPLPPYDTVATLDRLAELVRRWRPRRVVALGDSFHDRLAADRMASSDRDRLAALLAGRDWIWIRGNHDPAPPAAWGGVVAGQVEIDGLTLRHEAAAAAVAGEVSGHFHPKASIRVRAGRLISARCFVTDGRRLVLPSFGAYTGGLDVFDQSFQALFPAGFRVLLLGRGRAYDLPRQRLTPWA